MWIGLSREYFELSFECCINLEIYLTKLYILELKNILFWNNFRFIEEKPQMLHIIWRNGERESSPNFLKRPEQFKRTGRTVCMGPRGHRPRYNEVGSRGRRRSGFSVADSRELWQILKRKREARWQGIKIRQPGSMYWKAEGNRPGVEAIGQVGVCCHQTGKTVTSV